VVLGLGPQVDLHALEGLLVEDQALSPLRTIIGAVVGGIWIGDGADAFVDELSQLVIPGVGRVMDDISTYSKDIQHAVEVIDQADQQVRGIANHLNDVFNFY
jgi:uncharacterized protein YukE